MSTRAAAGGMLSAIERSGYYPGLVADAVCSAVGTEEVVSYFVHHDAHFDPGMEVRRHMTVLALTPTRLVYSHTDEYPAHETQPNARPLAEPSTEAIRCSRASCVPPSWNSLRHVELEPAHCGDETCDADHGYTGAITSDDVTMRVSEAADGADAITQVLEFARALTAASSAL